MGAVTGAVEVMIGADIGQRVDATALAVAELQWRGEERREGIDDHWVIRHLGRLPLGTPYPQIVAELVRIVDGVKGRVERVPVPLGGGRYEIQESRPRVTLYVDATG